MIKFILICIIITFWYQSVCGQCPDRTFLWNHIVYLRDSSQLRPEQQLQELNHVLKSTNTCPDKYDSVQALLLVRIGWLYKSIQRYDSAILFTNRGIDLIYDYINHFNINASHLIKYYNNLQILYDSTGQEKLRNRAIDSCIYLSIKWNTGYKFSVYHISNKIEDLFSRGDYFQCIQFASLGENISAGSGYRPEDLFYYTCWKINGLIFLNKFEEASKLVERSLANCIKSGDQKYLGTLLTLKATIAIKTGSPSQAILFARRSLVYDEKAGNPSGCAATLNNLGYELYFKKLHKDNLALKYLKEGLKFASKNDSLYLLNNIANIHLGNDDFNSAFNFFQQAFDQIYPGADEEIFLNNSGAILLNDWNVEYIIGLVLDKAEAFTKRYKQTSHQQFLQSALRTYKTADRLMDKIKVNQTELSSKLFWRMDMRRLYENAIETCYLLRNMEDAFYFFEKSRAVLLNDQLKEQETGDLKLTEMGQVRKKILGLEMNLNNLNPTSNEYLSIQRELLIYKEHLNQLDQFIKENNSWYYQSLIDTNFITLDLVQNELLIKNKIQAIFEFFNGDSAVYLLSILPARAVLNKINKSEFEKTVADYTDYLSNPVKENQDFRGFLLSGQTLYHLILSDSILPGGRIIISPDGRYFPFEALNTNTDITSPSYFLNEHAVSYTYSVRFLLNDFNKNKTVSNGNLLGLAPVTYPQKYQLASLPYSDESVDKICSIFSNAHSLIAAKASRENFMRFFQGYKMIQLYTHASDTSGNGEPVIYFADSALYLSDLIPENKTAAQLIVLSACETGNGRLYKGEGVFSFNRGFAALGIPSSVTNLWSVDNESTYRITELFYKYVSKGLPLDVALQKAKLDFISSSSKEKRLPYYWAAAILVGKTDAVELSSSFHWKLVFVILGAAAISLLNFFLIRKKSQPVR